MEEILILPYVDMIEKVREFPDQFLIITTVANPFLLPQLQIELGLKVVIYTTTMVDEVYAHYLINQAKNYWNINYESQVDLWVSNLMSEVEFWYSVADKKETGYVNRMKEKPFICPSLNNHEVMENAIVMDVGCGLYTRYGSKLPSGELIQLIPVDPLSYFYDRINRKFVPSHRYSELLTIQWGMFEFLSLSLGCNFADVIIIDNALDHCIDPVKAIFESLKVLKIGGVLTLRHNIREGMNGGYHGLHQWNIDVNDRNELVIWNDNKNIMNINEALKGYVDIKVICDDRYNINAYSHHGSVIVNIVKRSVPDSSFYEGEDGKRCLAVMNRLMKQLVDTSYMEEYVKLWSR